MCCRLLLDVPATQNPCASSCVLEQEVLAGAISLRCNRASHHDRIGFRELRTAVSWASEFVCLYVSSFVSVSVNSFVRVSEWWTAAVARSVSV